MPVSRIQDSIADGIKVMKGLKGGSLTADATAEMALTNEFPPLLFLDPAGGAKTILLPPEEDGLMFVIVNMADAAEDITVEEDSSTTAIVTISQNEAALVVCNGVAWRGMVGGIT